MRTLICTLAAGLLAFCTGCGKTIVNAQSSAIDPGKYYAVLLENNSVYFGKLDALVPDYIVLRDVYYVQSNVDPKTKAVNNVLVRRGQEWHGPDQMMVNQRSIVLIEPVGMGSKVAQLIAQSRK